MLDRTRLYPSQDSFVLPTPARHQLDSARHEVVGRPKVEMTVVLSPLRHIEREKLLVRHRRIARLGPTSEREPFVVPRWINDDGAVTARLHLETKNALFVLSA
jgi:hypothetical protein